MVKHLHLYSHYLNREVGFDVFLPPSHDTRSRKYPLLLLNDGQESEAVGLLGTLDDLQHTRRIEEIIAVGVYASAERLQEYGVAAQADYKRRGAKAGAYTDFLLKELLPFLAKHYHTDLHSGKNAIGGYSLGGLSAFDVAWNHPDVFKKVGVFSGSFWWRRKAYEEGYVDNDRIMHHEIRVGNHKPGMRFWLQAGTLDETADRNRNGIIDAIDDTLDIIVELTRKGYRPWDDIQYYQMEGGEHSPQTWAKAMPVFLRWAFGV
ncbi:MAG: esterase family protein [Cytophagales bacterium]|nr:esterase family protein [Cytophagales bacterium]